jgi:hypothetical protein
MLFKLLRGAVRRTRIAGTMSSTTTLSIGLEPAYYAPQRPNLILNLTNAVPRGHRCCFECSQSGSLSHAGTGSRSAVVANGSIVAWPRTLEFPVSALLARSCALAHAAHAPIVFRHDGFGWTNVWNGRKRSSPGESTKTLTSYGRAIHIGHQCRIAQEIPS